jgi:signal transduction histidine kinase
MANAKRMSLATKIVVVMLGSISLAFSGAVVSTLSALHTRGAMDEVVRVNTNYVRGASELSMALLRQRGLARSFLLDGRTSWLDLLGERRPAFPRWLTFLKGLEYQTAAERRLLASIEAAFIEYDGECQRALSRPTATSPAERDAVIQRTRVLHDRLYTLCEDLVESAQDALTRAESAWREAVRRSFIMSGACAGLTVILSSGLLWFMLHEVLLPLRRLASDARSHGQNTSDDSDDSNDLRAVGFYVDTLKSDAKNARVDLDDSRARLARAEKLATVGKLAASVAHEIRNPLTSLKLRLYSISRSFEGDPRHAQDLEVVSREIDRLELTIHHFLEFSRPPRLEIRRCSLEAVLDETTELFGHRLAQGRMRLVRQGDRDMPPISADPQQLKQVFVNLLGNAIEAMEAGGTVRVLAERQDEDGCPGLRIRVSDEGTGIPAKARAHLFEPFFSTKPDGTGLGLCIAGRIMARHGGSLGLESTSTSGTTFSLWIPSPAEEA